MPAGSFLSDADFGNATMNNVLIQTGQKSYVESLAERFAAEVPSTITFAFDSAVLDAAARATLDRQAHWIRQFPEVRFSVFGHTDLVGTAAYNHRLGLRRANAVVNYLVSRGVHRSRLDARVSLGQTQPLIVTSEPERRNRRTVTEVSGFVQRHPTVLNGRYALVVQREYIASAARPLPSISGQGASLAE
jgi:outer membrane protein OmpA-like peptidoglycan-associated protein